ncbi:MAG: restriction endonuclease subunit S [Bacteroidales bacterium]|nr:restriction endonuclease subunit S [Bacteroidales bacterium]
MGSEQHTETAKRSGGRLGKIDAPLNRKLQQVKWGEFEIGRLFSSENGNFDIQKEHLNGRGYFVVSAGETDNGIIGKTDIDAKVFDAQTITVDMFGNVFYRNFKYKMVTHARVFSLKANKQITDNQGLFLANSMLFFKKLFGYENMCSWEKVKGKKIQLPLTASDEIDFEFMENFIAELEVQRVAELEAYLSATGLKDYTLTAEEEAAVREFEKVEWGEFEIGRLFEILDLKFKKSVFDKINDISKIKTKEFDLPLVNAKNGDNGVMYYGRSKDFDIAEMTLDIVNDGAVSTGNVYIQPQKTGVLYNAYLVKPNFENVNIKTLLFFAATIEKSIKLKFGYENKASWEKVKKEKIQLPTRNGNIDYSFMELFISAIQKRVIADVVRYADRKIEATKEFSVGRGQK